MAFLIKIHITKWDEDVDGCIRYCCVEMIPRKTNEILNLKNTIVRYFYSVTCSKNQKGPG